MSGIKADKWIKRMCTPPSFVVTEMVPREQPPNSMLHFPPVKHEYLSHATEEELLAAVAITCSHNISMNSSIGIISYRKATLEDLKDWVPMIEPFAPGQVRTRGQDFMFRQANPLSLTADYDGDEEYNAQKIISYGTSSYGYDVRCADEFKVFTNINSTIVDPKDFDPNSFVNVKGDKCIIPPNSFALARTVEKFKIPRNVLTVCLGKSTYARCGIIVNVTPFEPEWEGYVTLEFSNTTPLPAVIYANEGCAQVLFFESDEVCDVSYKDRGGKYQNQPAEVIVPRT
jgi:dCTP deaminase